MAEQVQIVFIGAGNLATNLAVALYKSGCEIIQIYSRTEKSAKVLAQKVAAGFTTDLSEIYATADLYIYALKDNALVEVINKINIAQGLHIHTAGSMDMNVFEGKRLNYGVFYPLQTFSKTKLVDFSEIPIFIEANNSQNIDYLNNIAQKITKQVYKTNSEDRQILHLASVFANNFTNYLYTIAQDILATKQLPFKILLPLISESVNKLQQLSPIEAQTGPAVRGDKNVIKKHLNLLDEHKDWQKLYEQLSQAIQSQHNYLKS